METEQNKNSGKPIILIIDDEAVVRLAIKDALKWEGYDLIFAENGLEGIEKFREVKPSLVIIDLRMPVMDGIAFLEEIKPSPKDLYTVAVLTGHGDDVEIKQCYNLGISVFMRKPFNVLELRGMVANNIKLKKVEEELLMHTKHLDELIKQREQRLSQAYVIIKKDLEAAAKMQKSLLPKPTEIDDFKFDWFFNPASYIGGDIFNYFRLDEFYIGFYLLDVTGHGIPSALMSFSISKVLTPMLIDGNPLKRRIPNSPLYEILEPNVAAQEINSRFQKEKESIQYFTLIYGVIEIKTGITKMVQAGHPSPILIKKDKEPIKVGKGGFPLGIISKVDYEQEEFIFDHGDRLIIYSDGITDCTNENGEFFSEKGLTEFININRNATIVEFTEKLEMDLKLWNGKSKNDDDITLLVIERK